MPRSISLLLAALITAPAPWAGAAGGLAALTVDICTDSAATVPGGAPGELRRLITDAPAGALILIPADCTIVLTGSSGNDDNSSGDLDITRSLTIQGAGPGRSVIDGGGVDRVVHVIGASTVVAISGITIRNGAPPNSAGGVLNTGATLTLQDVEITGNVGGLSSGGIRNEGGTLSLEGVTVHDNRAAGGDGGGLFNGASGITSLVNVTISGNRATGQGGGVEIGSGIVSFNNVTVTGNDADSDANAAPGSLGGGLRVTSTGTATIRNTILAANTRRAGVLPDNCFVTGTLQSFGSNLVQSSTGCPGLVPSSGPPGAQTGDVTGDLLLFGDFARLGPLALNGGRTLTHALLAGSPALDRGDGGCAATDQRGVNRPQNGRCDIGAFERGTSSVATLALADLDGDGRADLITAQGGGGRVRILSGATGEVLLSVLPFGPAYRGPLAVGACDLTGDGTPDVVVGGGGVPGPEIRVFDGRTGGQLPPLLGSILAFSASPLGSRAAVRGPVSVGCADVNGDGVPDLVAGAPAGAPEGPLVRVFSGRDGTLLREGLAFDPAFTGGVAVGP